MKRLNDNDLIETGPKRKINNLSESEVTELAFRRDCKNLKFFVPVAIFVYILAKYVGVIGHIVGWLTIVMFGLFLLQNLFTFFVCTVSFFGAVVFEEKGKRSNKVYNIMKQLVIVCINLAVYLFLAYAIYDVVKK